MISELLYDDILPQIKILNMVIPILMYFLTFTSKTLYFVQNVSFISDMNHYVDQLLTTLLMMSGFQRYIAGYTVANS